MDQLKSFRAAECPHAGLGEKSDDVVMALPVAGCAAFHSKDVLKEQRCLCGISKQDASLIGSIEKLSLEVGVEFLKIRNVSQLFNAKVKEKRDKLLRLCIQVIFNGGPLAGRRARQILWSKCFYEFTNYFGQNYDPEAKYRGMTKTFNKLEELLNTGISTYKYIARQMDRKYNLDLGCFIDVTVLQESETQTEAKPDMQIGALPKNCWENEPFAYATAFSALITMGNLYLFGMEYSIGAYRHLSSHSLEIYYKEAFQLNPALGLSHYKLGVLFNGENHNLDSVYCYLFSLVSMVPYSHSERNLMLLTTPTAECGLRPISGLPDFYEHFFLAVNVLFFDREAPNLHVLLNCVLVNLHKIMLSKPESIPLANLFKIASITLFCLSRLRMLKSAKIPLLHVFLLDLTSLAIDICTVNLEQRLLDKMDDITAFHDMYEQRFKEFEESVVRSRKEYEDWLATESYRKCVETMKEEQTPPRERLCHSSDCPAGYHLVADSPSDEGKKSDFKSLPSSKCKLHGVKKQLDRWQELDLSKSTDNEPQRPLKSGEKCQPKVHDCFTLLKNAEMISCVLTLQRNTPLSGRNDDVKSKQHVEQVDQAEQDQAKAVEKVKAVPSQPQRLKFLQKYNKINPNVILDFVKNESMMPCLKILFDWLLNCPEMFFETSDPNFLKKTMKLLNYFNLDLFSHEVYFEREFLIKPGIRPEFETLFNDRETIPIAEDLFLRGFDVFQDSQFMLDWSSALHRGVNSSEEAILRLCKMVDFGHFLCRQERFNYRFCAKTRTFVEVRERSCNAKETPLSRQPIVNREIEEECMTNSDNANEGRKGSKSDQRKEQAEECVGNAEICKTEALMPVVKVGGLQEKLNTDKRTFLVVVDLEAITKFTLLVKHLARSRTCTVFVPAKVLGGLHDMRRHNDKARNIMRWLKRCFKRNLHHLKVQHKHEMLSLDCLNIPRELQRAAPKFMAVAQFCHYLVKEHPKRFARTYKALAVTYLSADPLPVNENLPKEFTFPGILDALGVGYDQIASFHAELGLNRK